MEVHHHPEVEKKGIKEYLLEGLMIFLAVFMGFVAENVREHISDHTKEKEYVGSLLRDLKQDSAQLSDVFHATGKLVKGQDSLINFLNDSIRVAGFDNKCYRLFFHYATSLAMFNSTDRAITQLTSSGNLRLIGKQQVADSISNYYDKVKSAASQASLGNLSSTDCFQYAQNVFRLSYALKPRAGQKQLITHNADTLTRYMNNK